MIICEICEQKIDEEAGNYALGDPKTMYAGKTICDTCYYEDEPNATILFGEDDEPKVITSCRNETDGNFETKWVSTDAWRGYYEVLSETYVRVNSAELLSGHESEKMLAEFDKSIQGAFKDANIDYGRVFARSSNVFYTNFELFVRRDQIFLAHLLLTKVKREVGYDDPKWYRNIIFDQDALKTLTKLFPERKIKRDSDAVKIVETYGDEIVNEIQRRMQENV